MESIKVSAIIPTDKETLFKAWLNSKEHSNFTGAEAKITAKVNGKHSAWDGYISGVTKEIIPSDKIVQTWRTAEFAANDEDSILEVTFEDKGKNTKLNFHHYNIPKGQSKAYKSGWTEFYFAPMKEYYSSKK